MTTASTGRRVRLVLYGFGRVGRAAAELASTRPWLDLVGVISRSPASDAPRGDGVPNGLPAGLLISTDAPGTLEHTRPDVVVVATNSRLRDVLPQLRIAAAASPAAIVCTAEELAFVDPADGPEAAEIHRLAREHRVAILATGVNPGFVLDLWPLVASGVAWDVVSIEARRIVDVSVFGPNVRSKLGIGYTEDAFAAGVAAGSIVGHLGFRESIRAIASAMGTVAREIRIETRWLPVDVPLHVADIDVPAGHSAGVLQRATALTDAGTSIAVDLIVHVDPSAVGLRTLDELRIAGRNAVHVVVEGGYPAVMTTAALVINAIPRVLAAPPGVYRSDELPPTVPWLASFAPPGRAARP